MFSVFNSETSWWAGAFIIINAGLGAGLLNFADAYSAAGGIGVALTVQLVHFKTSQLFFIFIKYCKKTS